MDTTGIDTVTINGVVYDIPDDPRAVVLQEMFIANGLKPTMFSRLQPDYVRPNNTPDDVL